MDVGPICRCDVITLGAGFVFAQPTSIFTKKCRMKVLTTLLHMQMMNVMAFFLSPTITAAILLLNDEAVVTYDKGVLKSWRRTLHQDFQLCGDQTWWLWYPVHLDWLLQFKSYIESLVGNQLQVRPGFLRFITLS